MSKSKVRVFTARLALEPARISGLSQLLSEEERRRAGRFYFARDSRRFTAARAVLRLVLGQYLECAPACVEFAYGASGKPFLRDTTLRFNVSHSADIALVAVADGREVGVDVERVRPQPEMHRIAERVFSAREFAELQSAPVEAQNDLFFRLWTQNEARLKASSLGFGGVPQEAYDDWSVCPIVPVEGYVGAVAVQGGGFDLGLREFLFEDIQLLQPGISGPPPLVVSTAVRSLAPSRVSKCEAGRAPICSYALVSLAPRLVPRVEVAAQAQGRAFR